MSMIMMMIQWYAVQLLLLSVWLYYWFHSMFFVHFIRRCELEALFLINWGFLKKLFILNFDWRRPFRQYDFPNNRNRLDQSRLSIKYLSDKQSLSHTFQILGIPLSHPDDLSSFDYELHKNAVTWLQENCVNELDLSFNVDALNPWNSKPVTIELNDDCDKKLTDDNKVPGET